MAGPKRRVGSRRPRLGGRPERARVRGLVDRVVLGFLRAHPLFADASAEDLHRLAEHARPVRLTPGAFLFHEDDPATQVYVVESGRLEVLHERLGSSDYLPVAEVERGAVLGELGVMRGDVRTASIRAIESSALLALPGREFVAFVRATPSAGLRLAEILAERTRAMLIRDTADIRRGEVWVLERSERVGGDLAAALARAAWTASDGPPPTVWCAEGARVPLGKAHGLRFEPLDEPPRPLPGEVAVVLAPGEALPRLPFRPNALVTGVDAPTPDGFPADRHVRLAPSGALGPKTVRLAGSAHDVAGRVVRMLEHRTIGLALGGGGALGLSHLGVLEVLERERIPVDVIAGTSAGAMVGASYLVRGLADTLDVARAFTRPRLIRMIDPSFFLSGVIEGHRVLKWFRELMGEARIEDLPIPFAAMAIDLETGDERALSGGPVPEALRATISLASVFAPFSYAGEEGVVPGGTYIDAGGVNNVPVDIARELGGDRVIAVNVINRPKPWTRTGPPWRRWGPINRGKSIAYAEMIAFARNGERAAYTAELPIAPDTREFGFTQFYRAEGLIEAGRAAAEELLPQLRALRDTTGELTEAG